MEWIPIVQKIKMKIWFGAVVDKVHIFLKCFYFYLAFAGIFSFTAFIAEESIQLLSFAQFSASDTRQYALMKENLEYMERINNSLKFLNTWCLWVIPPQQLGYRHYAAATDRYIETLKAEILANDPSVYIGEDVTIRFAYKGYERKNNGLWVARSKGVKVVLKDPPQSAIIEITGRLRADPEVPGGVVIEPI